MRAYIKLLEKCLRKGERIIFIAVMAFFSIASTSVLAIENQSKVIWCDVDYDGRIGSDDASKILKIYAQLATGTYKDESISGADVNNDGRIDSSDASLILQEYANISTGGLVKFVDGAGVYMEVPYSRTLSEGIAKEEVAESTNPQGEFTLIEREDVKDKAKYFDLSVSSRIAKVIVNENGTETITEIVDHENSESIVKVYLKNATLNNVEVKFEYKICISNESEVAGYVNEVSEYIPKNLRFLPEDNPKWQEIEGRIITKIEKKLQPGETEELTVILARLKS